MPRAASLRFSACQWVAAFLVVLADGTSFAASPPDLSDLRAKVERALSAYQSVSCEFTVEEKFPPDGRWDALKFDGLGRWKWSKVGRSERIQMEPRKGHKSDVWHRVRMGLDGRRVARVDFSVVDPEILVGCNTDAPFAEFDRQFSPAHFLGLRLFEIDETLSSIMAKSDLEFVGEETIQGDACVRLRVSSLRTGDSLTTDCEVWLSPAVGYLPRQIRSTLKFRGDDGESTMVDTYRVSEFQMVPLAGGDQNVPFPRLAVNTGRGPDREFVIKNVRLGEGVVLDEITLPFDPRSLRPVPPSAPPTP